MKIKSFSHLAVIALVLAAPHHALQAQSNNVFTTTPNADYATAGNWTPAAVPVGNNTAIIGNNNVASAVYSSSTNFTTTGRLLLGLNTSSNGSLTMGAGAGTLTFGGNEGSAANNIGTVGGVNTGGQGSLTMNGGILRFIGSTGTTGYLRIGATGGVTVATPTGTATVNAGLLDIGHSASLGAVFNNSNTLNGTGSGTLTVAGTGQVIVGSGSSNATTGGNNGYLYLKNDAASSSGNATVNLNGGSLTAKRIVAGSGGGTKTLNFNGGTLIAGASDTSFLSAASGFTANVQNGGAVIDTQSFNITVGAALTANGTGGLTKTGAGALTLSATNTYTGNTTVSAGSLILNSTGSIASSQIGFAVTNASSGLLTAQNSAFSFTGTLALDLLAVSATSGSWTLFNGSEFGAGDLNLAALSSNLAGLTFTNGGGVWSGTDLSSRTWTFNEDFGQLTVIPEPSTWALVVLSLTAIIVLHRRRRTA